MSGVPFNPLERIHLESVADVYLGSYKELVSCTLLSTSTRRFSSGYADCPATITSAH
jgi:hypothetical protein